jgi:hypothetical protein
MNPTRRVRLSALILGCLATVLPLAAAADPYDAARQGLDFASDPAPRSPRLFGMGRLTVLLDDHNNRLTLWDFAGFPTGIVDADSVSSLEVRPGTAAASRVHDIPGANGGTVERQDLAAGELRTALEGWRREAGATSAFGLVGEFNLLRLDRPIDEFTERRSVFTVPRLMPILAGRLPFTTSGRTRYAMRIRYELQDLADEYRRFYVTPTGEYIDHDGELTDPPDLFTPDEYTLSTLGGGLAVSHRVSDALVAGVGLDVVRQEIEGLNEAGRHSSQTREERPYAIGQATLIGRIGPRFEWGADGRAWRSGSEETWNFTLSAGLGATPLVGLGKRLERDEEGSSLRARGRLDLGSLEFGAGLTTGYREIEITPPAVGDPTSFNYFRNTLQQRLGADTLSVPDSIAHELSQERSWEAVGGAAWQAWGGRATLAGQFHVFRARLDQQSSGEGPLRTGWDARGGVELRLTPSLSGRGGYIYRWDDRDDFSERNEYLSHTMTLGLGLHPPGSGWSVESGYFFEWQRPDFGDPDDFQTGRQQFVSQVRWLF